LRNRRPTAKLTIRGIAGFYTGDREAERQRHDGADGDGDWRWGPPPQSTRQSGGASWANAFWHIWGPQKMMHKVKIQTIIIVFQKHVRKMSVK